MKSGSHGNSH